jgi:hypothetical protein
MAKIARRPNLVRQSAAHFLAYFENAFDRYIVSCGGFSPGVDPNALSPEDWAKARANFGSITKKWIMDYSFVEQNIIPGWVNQARSKRGLYDTRKLIAIAKEQIKLEAEAATAKEVKAKAAAEAKELRAKERAAKAAAKTAKTPKESAA